MQLHNLTDTSRTYSIPFNDTVTVQLRHISRDELLSISKQCRITRFVNHQKVEEIDSVKGDCLLGRAVIKGWSGIKAGDEDALCTPDNIDLVMTRHNTFAKFINDICTDIDTLVQEEQEAERKN